MHVSDEQLHTLKQKLEENRVKLMEVSASLEKTDPANDTERGLDNADIGTEATESGELVRHESLENETRIMLERTEAALARMENGTYGHTEDGQDIPYERLLVDPTATTLVTQS